MGGKTPLPLLFSYLLNRTETKTGQPGMKTITENTGIRKRIKPGGNMPVTVRYRYFKPVLPTHSCQHRTVTRSMIAKS
uniref:Uncharacterized protein n=1 Tax=Arundo donax TaxID=35708 RepID=A0A0A9H5Q2_ARUDO